MTDPLQFEETVQASPHEHVCREHALVLRAMGIECIVQPSHEGFVLLVARHDVPRARAELDAYTHENRHAALPDAAGAPRTDGWAGVFSYASVILLVAVCADRRWLGLDWYGAGKTSATLIRDGEWWRTITALTLHADQPHLLANLVIGSLFGLFAARLLGSGLAWFSILLGGAAGNWINAWLRPAGHTSVGASTAIFAALGIVSAWAWTQRRSDRVFSLARWSPLIGGIILLGYLGTGGTRTDVFAHVAGFVSGAVLGALYGMLGVHARVTDFGQAVLATGALLLLVAGWSMALMPG